MFLERPFLKVLWYLFVLSEYIVLEIFERYAVEPLGGVLIQESRFSIYIAATGPPTKRVLAWFSRNEPLVEVKKIQNSSTPNSLRG